MARREVGVALAGRGAAATAARASTALTPREHRTRQLYTDACADRSPSCAPPSGGKNTDGVVARTRDIAGSSGRRYGPPMMRSVWVVAVLLAGCAKAPSSSTAPVSSAPVVVSPEGGAVAITADEKGFTPTEVHATQGAPLTLVFTRTSDNTCAKEIVFPELKLRRPLPLNQAVAVALPTQVARSYRFQCGMAMWEGSVVITEVAK
jgi:hypothetical protein